MSASSTASSSSSATSPLLPGAGPGSRFGERSSGTGAARPADHESVATGSSTGWRMAARSVPDRKRRLTGTADDARLQRTRSGSAAGRDGHNSSWAPLPYRSVSMVLPSSRTRSSVSDVPGSSYATAIDIASSPPAESAHAHEAHAMRSIREPGGPGHDSSREIHQAPWPPAGPAQQPDAHRARGVRSSGSSSAPNPESSGSWSSYYPRQAEEIQGHLSSLSPQGDGASLTQSGRYESMETPGYPSVSRRHFVSGIFSPGGNHERPLEMPQNILPRWQPDSEVENCPICGIVFSFWYRKHHCRKCGRVVCASCSPHRITIPRQYIVRPPESAASVPSSPPMAASRIQQVIDLTGDNSGPLPPTINPALGGGEEVRLCNPCVPDPNPNPLGYSSPRPHGHRPTHSLSSTMGSHYSIVARDNSNTRQERRTLGTNERPSFLRDLSQQIRQSASNEEERRRSRRATALPDASTPATGLVFQRQSLSREGTSAPSSPFPLRRPVVSDRDLCPVCGRRFPALSPDQPTEAREAHIRYCIENYGVPTDQHAPSPEQPGPPLPQPPPVPRMLEFTATEKDCLGEDGEVAECTICMEDYEVGHTLARLECLCKFHKSCIVGWFARKTECPVHKVT
ncbi:hypothetical protein NUU61_005739 [Penicillium alfredii]|uniref:RING-type E3 ubiquitin transferase n=1 Tax=Penicillium alfredii TaxID=1506179 RepID=A0A9W9FA31_9EURO|nr:uncharacterized protein NUU61_005739 [Penicillium alfredii]KAJ5096383.1 hypothetical protein NUU61_005739 [Penicillium alfredii]